MRLRRRLIAMWRHSARGRALFWATLIGVLCGVLGLLEPLDDMSQNWRAWVLSRPADGKTVVIAVDDKSLAALGRWPWSRAKIAELIDKLNEAGVKSIYFDFVVKGASDPQSDARFFEAVKNSRAPVMLAGAYDTDSRTGGPTSVLSNLPVPHAQTVLISWDTNYAGDVRVLRLGGIANKTTYPTMSAHMAGHAAAPGEHYSIDLSIDPTTVPTVSAVDVLSNRTGRAALGGKIVVFAPTSFVLFDMHNYPARGQFPGVYLHVAGAQTLREGGIVDIGWLPLFAASLVAVGLICWKCRRRPLLALGGTGLAVFLVPVLTESCHVTMQFTPALTFLMIVTGHGLWRRAKREGALVNALSGLANLNALSAQDVAPESIVVVARINNFADIISSLKPEMQASLIAQVFGRLSVGAGSDRLFQGDDGIFAWLKPQSSSPSISDELEGLHSVMRVPVQIEARSIDLQMTFGVERDATRSLANRLGSATFAAENALAQGRHWLDFDADTLETADWRLSMLGQIDIAIDTRQIWVAYQPQLNLKTGQIESAEALVRWEHPTRGNVAPDEFVLHAERTGRIDRLTGHVIDIAAKGVAGLVSKGFDFRVSVNISASLLDMLYLHDLIVPPVDAAGLAHDRVTLEITESAEIKLGSNRVEKLDRLRALGFHLSIDDYGTGFSTLDYLKRIEAGEIKIDKSFVAQITTSEQDRALVESTIDLAHALGRRVVAEGVETEAALEMLRAMGCDMAQGYLIGRPMTLLALTEMLTDVGRSKRTA